MTLKEFGWKALRVIGEIIMWAVIVWGIGLIAIVLYNMHFY